VAEFREADRHVLDALNEWHKRQVRLGRQYDFARPMDIGGRGTSGHSQALARLVKLGLVDRRQRTDVGVHTFLRSRASWEYRITEAGIAKLGEAT
jgi:predicted transcriptional regulator